MAETKKPDIWMPLYVADYQADTAYLTTEQHGAYLLMLMAYWRNGPIPDNDQIIAAITRQTPNAWSITRAVLEPMFQVSGGFWIHKRVEKEYEKASRNRSAAHDKAVKAANARWGKDRENMLEALPEHMPMQCPSPSPSPSPSQSESNTPLTPQGGNPVDQPATPPAGSGQTDHAGKPAKRKREAKPAMMLTDWLTSLGDEPAIRDDDPILAELELIGVSRHYALIAWHAFKTQFGGKRPQKDWPAHFRNAIRGNWLKVWYFDSNGQCLLTTAGEQARRAMDASQ